MYCENLARSDTELVECESSQMPKRSKKKPSAEETADKLARIAMRGLAKLPPEEQESRVAAFSRVVFKKKSRGNRATLSQTEHAPVYPATARGRE